MSRSKAIGTAAESAVVRFLRPHGWPYAERLALSGAADRGDITGTPGVVWEVKSGRSAETAGDSLIRDWLEETETERRNAGADVAVLVTKRAGFSADRAASWWAHMDAATLAALLGARRPLPDITVTAPVRMHLSAAAALLRAAGYGEPLHAREEAA
ncbi:hypothetical protein CDO52_00295 [Nocardiopsis gilva YIM 90087]|uniref:Holliday junction resolvase n=1 Tax=Nocardiopsis gilva YIM 90087 TaxID=1235441 RepID=A0A223RZW3_9ACTN|nr:hypothetical protein [Nocardiopsis gilva]ASU81423.1 hypothetical protein CDO52_00295 [Nocardiopsis gilva YIM 90087]